MKRTTASAFAVISLALCCPALTQDEVHDLILLQDFLAVEPYRSAWDAMLKGAKIDTWITRYSQGYEDEGTPSPSMPIQIDGENYRLAQVCKRHWCSDNGIYVLFSPDGRRAWGLIVGTRLQWLGHPDARIQKAIIDECIGVYESCKTQVH